MNINHRELKKMFEKIGCDVESIIRTKHLHVTYSYKGHKFTTICPCTPSTHNWYINKKHEIKRVLRVSKLIA